MTDLMQNQHVDAVFGQSLRQCWPSIRTKQGLLRKQIIRLHLRAQRAVMFVHPIVREIIRLQQVLNAQTVGQKRKFQHDVGTDDLTGARIRKRGAVATKGWGRR